MGREAKAGAGAPICTYSGSLRRVANSFPGTPRKLVSCCFLLFWCLQNWSAPPPPHTHWEQLMRAREERTLCIGAQPQHQGLSLFSTVCFSWAWECLVRTRVISSLQNPVTLRYSFCAVTDLSKVYLYESFLIFGYWLISLLNSAFLCYF